MKNPLISILSVADALDDCDAALIQLSKACCDPGRSPQIIELAETLDEARRRLDAIPSDPGLVKQAIADLESAGAQVGRLQVGRGAPNRMPLYVTILAALTEAHTSQRFARDRVLEQARDGHMLLDRRSLIRYRCSKFCAHRRAVKSDNLPT